MMVGDTSESIAQLNELRELGVAIAMDDFGTGYSSLSALRTLPIDVMKIDRSFVKDLGTDSGALAMIQTIVTLAKSLGFQLVAEGVETSEQARTLKAMSCEELQGYFYGKGLPPKMFATLPSLAHRHVAESES